MIAALSAAQDTVQEVGPTVNALLNLVQVVVLVAILKWVRS